MISVCIAVLSVVVSVSNEPELAGPSQPERGVESEPARNAALAPARSAPLPKVLFLTHSAGFVHDVVKRPSPGELALAERGLSDAAKGRYDVRCTQDCAEISAETLAGVQAVCFYTTGELPISDAGKSALMSWMQNGGAFVGLHCATDTFYQYQPYVDMIGGLFDGHPWHQAVRVRVDEPKHPATAKLPSTLELTDEIYQFKAWQRHPLAVLMSRYRFDTTPDTKPWPVQKLTTQPQGGLPMRVTRR